MTEITSLPTLLNWRCIVKLAKQSIFYVCRQSKCSSRTRKQSKISLYIYYSERYSFNFYLNVLYIFLDFYILQYPKSHFVYLFLLQILVDGKIISSFTRALNLENRCCNNVCKDKRFTLRQMTIMDLERSYYICI